jgi:hypothetical protein
MKIMRNLRDRPKLWRPPLVAVSSSGCILFKELCQKSCIFFCLKIQLHVLLPVVFGIIDLSTKRYLLVRRIS